MNTHTGEHLTTSRISRLLRPLRLKCQKLASYSPEATSQRSRGSVVVTYGHVSRADAGERRDEPPLAIIPPPEKLSVLSKLDRASREKLEFSRRIYDVRDAFRNVLSATFASGAASRRGTPQHYVEGRVRGLAAMCASAVGGRLEEQIAMAAEEREEQEGDEEEDQEILDSLYDAVYPQYRKYTIISHALSIILASCSSNHTLLTILLELVVSYNLTPEARIVLRHLFQRSIQPFALPGTSNTIHLELSHPAHSRYLTNLLDTCCPPMGGTMTPETFVQTFAEVVHSIPSGHGAQIWDLKATIHLARSLRTRDYPAFLSMCYSAGTFLTTHIETSKLGHTIPASYGTVISRLGKWLSHVCQRAHDISLSPPTTEAAQEISIISDILGCTDWCRLHRSSKSGEARVLLDAIVCLVLMLLTPPIAGLLPNSALEKLHSVLRAAPVQPGTFGILIDVTMPPASKPVECGAFDSVASIHSAADRLDRWASTLRAHAYHLFEASFWSSALLHVEHLTPEPGTHYDPASHHSSFLAALERLRCDIVRRVDTAEARCFAHGGGGAAFDSAQTPRKGSVPAQSEWRWEDMLGCWVQRTPAPAAAGSKRSRPAAPDARPAKQRRRTEDVTRPARPPAGRAPSVASSASTAPARRASAPRSAASAVSTSGSSAGSSRLPTPHDGEEDLLTPSAQPKPVQRRLPNFASILRDAQLNRVVLHAESSDDEGAWLRDAHGRKPRHVPAFRPPVDADDEGGDAELVDARGSLDEPSSDDALDLFAYRSSEW